MAIYETYAKFIMEGILRDQILGGTAPSYRTVIAAFDSYTSGLDLTKPVFSSLTYEVEPGDESSATDYNEGLFTAQQDMRVLFKHLLGAEIRMSRYFARWRAEAERLEGRLKDLEDRIINLLLLTKDTEGYFNYVYDSLTDASKASTSSTTLFDKKRGMVTLGASSLTPTRIDLSNAFGATAVNSAEFTVLSQNSLVSSTEAAGSKLQNVISDKTNYWQNNVVMDKPGTVTSDLIVSLAKTQSFSRIDVDLHAANQNSKVSVTPMYSADKYNWKQLPITNFTREVTGRTTFQFGTLSAKYIKLLITKPGYDRVSNSQYVYEFGMDEVAIHKENYGESDKQQIFYSTALSVVNVAGVTQSFSKAVLEVCENVPTNTSIDYSLAVSNTKSASIGSLTFMPIDPVNRTSYKGQTILDFGELNQVTVSGVGVSYDTAGATGFKSPDKDYTMITGVSGTSATTSAKSATATRYVFSDPSLRLLDYQFASLTDITDGTLEIWRNVNVKGTTTKVRDTSNGWREVGAWYHTTVWVNNKSGVTINFGSKAIQIDGFKKTGVTKIAYGAHRVAVHKDNWIEVSTTSVTDLASLKTADTLYPYNHRYLVEGLAYPTGWATTAEKVYLGFDIVAEYLMKKTSVFDMMANTSGDFSRFSLDKDMAETGEVASNVFLVRVDSSQADFVNENFTIRFKSAVSSYQYIWLKAALATTASSVAPALDSYRVKVGN